MRLTRRTAVKALAGIVTAPLTPTPLAATPVSVSLPVTPHELYKCPRRITPDWVARSDDEMCSACYDVMTDEFSDALDPIVARAIDALWRSIHADLPFVTRPDNDFYDIAETVRSSIEDAAFEEWQRSPEAAKIRAALPVGDDED